MLFLNTKLEQRTVDLRVEGTRITQITPAGRLTPAPKESTRRGGRITPPMAEPHVHLDAALLGARAPNKSGTLREGISNWSRLREELTGRDVQDRAIETAELYASTGTLRIRSHVDTGSLVAVQALLDLKLRLATMGVELQVVAFPQEGILRAPGRLEKWEEAVKMGCDAVGGIPHFERTREEGNRSVELVFDLAEKHNKLIDFHCDESDDPHSRHLEVVAAQTIDRGFQGKVVAGHCTSLHSVNHPYAEKVMELVAEAQVQVIANPLDNVVLQGRYDRYPKRRGITRVDELWDAGALVGIGHDSVQDPWYRLGTGNMLDPAYMLVHVAQLTSETQMHRTFHTLTTENHLPFGGVNPLKVKGLARFLWWENDDPIEVLRTRTPPEVFRGLDDTLR